MSRSKFFDENKKLLGSLTDGDLRRSILSGIKFSEDISSSFNTKPTILFKNKFSHEEAKQFLRDKKLARKLRLLKAFGVDRSHSERKIPGVYDTVALGFNYRMSEIHAAIGTEQLKKLEGFLKIRRENFILLENLLSGVEGLRVLPQPVDEQRQRAFVAGKQESDDEFVERDREA